MNKQHLTIRISLCFFVFLTTILPLTAQLELSVNRADAIYGVGETAFFQAKATFSSPATYEIIYDEQSPVVETGTVNLIAGQNVSIPYRLDEPGLVICRVNLNNVVREASAVFAPLEISPLEEEPSDFDAFWATQKNLKNNLPMDMQMSYHNESSYQTTYTFSIANIEGRRTYGYISIPKGNGPFPASITLPPFGSSHAVVGADTESAEKGGMIAVSISIHNRPVNQDDPNAYQPDDNTDRDRFYYRYGLIGAMHVIDYLETRSDFDGNVCAMGVSQGGGLSILLAGIDDRISLLINSNPAMGQHIGYSYDRASGFPYYLSMIDAANQGNTALFNTAANATKYYDAMFHARRFKGASFSLTGMKDLVVPSATALVSHNQLPGSKVLMISRDGGHDHPNEYWNGRFEFMRRHFAGSNNPPFRFGSTNKGFLADAGNNQTVGTSANLNGEVFYDNDQLNNLSVFWRKVSGPGNVSFSNANGYNTTANFSSNGTYVLQFVGRDDRKLANEGKIYYISDEVTITATGGGNPTFTLDVSCPANQSIELAQGQSQTNVFWNEPAATSNCGGGASFFQLSGPANGSAFFEGNYTISYRAIDNCGNSEDCSFTINVTQAQTQSSAIDLSCPSDIIVDAAAGDNEVTVSWASPIASTTCNTGGSGSTGGSDCASTFISGYAYMGTFDNSQFYLSNNNANWTDAKAAAENEGGRLAIINDAAENDFIQQNINNEIVFIGLSDVEQEGNLRWVDGSPVGYSKYVSGLNNNNDNDFVTVYPWNGEWDLNNQFVTKKYVLEIPCSNGGGSDDSEVTINQTSGTINGGNFSVGTTTVSYTATDNCGNSETCSFNVIVNGSAASLSINCPADINVQIPAGQTSIPVSWNAATATSNCNGGATATKVNGANSGDQFESGNYTITYQASDNCGNQEVCSFTINVTNTPTDLSINCPADRAFQIPAGQTQMQVNWNLPTASSNCPNGTTVNQIGGPGNFAQLSAGTYTITYEATDNCGNRETCSFTIIIETSASTGGSELTINCPSDIIVEIPFEESATNIDWAIPTVSTTCVINGGGTTCSGDTNVDGYSYLGEFEGSRYYKSNQPLSFPLALTAVANEGGTLAKINSAAENEFLRQNIGSDLCIIGLSDSAVEGEWLWTDGSAPTYLNFPANLNNNPSDDFAVMNFWNGEWELTTDFIYKRYILEIPCASGNDNTPSDIQLDQIEGPANGSNFGVGTTTIAYEAMDECGNITTCRFNVIITQAAAPNNGGDNGEGPPTPVVSVASTAVTGDFQVTIAFDEPVTSLSGYDLAISNANWYNFSVMNGKLFTVILDPLSVGEVRVSVPANVAFDSDIQGNLASNTVFVNYNPIDNGGDDSDNNLPSIGSCLIQPVSIVLEDGATVGGDINNIINGTGLSAEDDLTALHGGGNLYDGVWLNDGTDVSLRLDLGQIQTVDGIALWNYSYHTWLVLKRRGVKDFHISTSEDGDNYSTPAFYSAVSTTERGEKEEVQIFNFPSTTARYIRLRILNANDDSFYAGLGEVRFMSNCSLNSNIQRVANEDIAIPVLTLDNRPKEIAIYPNPTNNTFFVNLGNNTPSKTSIEVMNEIGSIVYEQRFEGADNKPVKIDLWNQADGFYLVRIIMDDAPPILKKMVKTSR